MRRFVAGIPIAFAKVMAVLAGCLILSTALCVWLSSLLELDVEHFQAHLPANVRPQAIKKSSSVIFSPMEGCGTTVLLLEPKVTAAIASGGLTYLNEDLTTADDSREIDSWRQTPAPDLSAISSKVNDGINGLAPRCTPDFSQEEREEIFELLKTPGGYWTRGHESILIIYPDFERMVFSSFG